MVAFPRLSLPIQLPCVMGVVNVTPDSFSDGGRFFRAEAAVAHGVRLRDEGAAIVDVGGESTRPGAQPITAADELGRVLPVLEGLGRAFVGDGGGGSAESGAGCGSRPVISIDTSKAEVARRALAAGATMINDVSALRHDAAMAEVAAEAGCGLCLMHMLGEPRTMQDDPRYGDVVAEVAAFLEERLAFAVAHGVREEQVLLDPGIGFGKTVEHNLLLIRRLPTLAALGRPLVLGTSRKRFLGALLGAEPDGRLIGTVATTVLGLVGGAAVFRAHDVKPNVEALAVTRAVLEAGENG